MLGTCLVLMGCTCKFAANSLQTEKRLFWKHRLELKFLKIQNQDWLFYPPQPVIVWGFNEMDCQEAAFIKIVKELLCMSSVRSDSIFISSKYDFLVESIRKLETNWTKTSRKPKNRPSWTHDWLQWQWKSIGGKKKTQWKLWRNACREKEMV